MSILFDSVWLPTGETAFVTVEGRRIAAITPERPQGPFDRVIDGRGKLLTPGLVNTHCHAAMTLLRGYGEDLPLDRWLNERIFPAEDLLSDRSVYLASGLAVAEMLAGGVTSFSDMYFFCDATARAVAEGGIKANLSRSIVSFDETADYAADTRVQEALALHTAWNGAEEGRIRIDLSLHAEYTNVAPCVRYVAACAAKRSARVQIHLSETEKEHRECLGRHGVTPTRFFLDNGLFEVPVVAAHCVYLDEADREILASHGATAVHNPISNLKLGSGVMPLGETVAAGVTVALGTDGAASNNRLDLLREMQTALLLGKGITRRPEGFTAAEGLRLATENGARSQGREDTGRLAVGCCADLALFDLTGLSNLPVVAPVTALAYSASAADVCLTMVDGRILYENGEFTTLDVEKLKHEFSKMRAGYFN
ncbi:MAG: amidohydrolase [Clostridia bacterium]|nr:amidohydrolase [Clostridia bacterium]